MVRYFRKKSVIIEAVQFKEIDAGEDINLDEVGYFLKDTDSSYNGSDTIIIHTLEGDMQAKIGDWIIKGIKGEFYPCKSDIFEETYEEVKPNSSQH